jgi:hypothetical protein
MAFRPSGDLTADFGCKTADSGRKSDADVRHVAHRRFGSASLALFEIA